jgi:FdhD protein
MLSGRASFEIMQKALAAGLAVVAAVSAPSNLAASFADESGQTLIGFVRGRRLNVYAGRQRVDVGG